MALPFAVNKPSSYGQNMVAWNDRAPGGEFSCVVGEAIDVAAACTGRKGVVIVCLHKTLTQGRGVVRAVFPQPIEPTEPRGRRRVQWARIPRKWS